MASAKSSRQPVRRDFVVNNDRSSRRTNGRIFRFLFLTLVALVVALSAIAVYLYYRVTQSSSSSSSRRPSHSSGTGIRDAPKRDVSISSAAAAEKWPPSKSIVSPKNDSGDRVYCMIPFIWNEEMYTTIMETWGKRCDVINFLTDAIVGGKLKGDKITDDPLMGYKPYWEYPPGTFPDNVIFINMTRTWNDCDKEDDVKKVCRHIWEKMWRSWVYVEENHLDQAEWFCKVDYDTFFFPENVKYFVREYENWDPFTEYHYFGHLIQSRHKGSPPFIAGATVCWSRKTLDDIADVYRKMPKGRTGGYRGKCEDRAQATEEASTAICLFEHLNVSAYAARDDELREYVSIDRYKDVLTWNRTQQGEWWYWRGKPEGAGEMENSITTRPIGIHKYKETRMILELEQQFYGPANNREIKRLNPRSRTYVDKVRKNLGMTNE